VVLLGDDVVAAVDIEHNATVIICCSVFTSVGVVHDLYELYDYDDVWELYNVMEYYVFQNEFLILSYNLQAHKFHHGNSFLLLYAVALARKL